MDNYDFNTVVEHRISSIREVLLKKAAEYARNGDRLHNFKRASAIEQCSPVMALRGFLTKHIVSIYDMIDDCEAGCKARPDIWNEKIGDAINYLILLEALITETHAPK